MKRSLVGLSRVDLLYTFDHREGFMYSAPIMVNGDTNAEPLKSKLVMFEDGVALRRGHEQHSVIIGTGRGSYSHWERHVYFSASDNSDPNRNGRAYSYAVDHAGQHKQQDSGVVALHAPYYLQTGLCWGVAVTDEGDDVASGALSSLRLSEDGILLGPSHAQHYDIANIGQGHYSHWSKYLYFSTSDGSNPNTNGRLYSYEIDI